MIPHFNSLSVGILPIPPEVVAEKSPIAWTELTANKSAIAIAAEGSNSIPKGISLGAWKIPALITLVKLRELGRYKWYFFGRFMFKLLITYFIQFFLNLFRI